MSQSDSNNHEDRSKPEDKKPSVDDFLGKLNRLLFKVNSSPEDKSAHIEEFQASDEFNEFLEKPDGS